MDATLTWVLIFVGIMERILRLWIVEDDPERITETSGKIPYLSFGVIMFMSFVFVVFYLRIDYVVPILVVFLTVATIFRAFMEWKYIRGEREHIVTLITLVIQSICLLVFVG